MSSTGACGIDDNLAIFDKSWLDAEVLGQTLDLPPAKWKIAGAPKAQEAGDHLIIAGKYPGKVIFLQSVLGMSKGQGQTRKGRHIIGRILPGIILILDETAAC